MKLLNHFSRITTAGRTFLPQIDGLRFIAILGVLAFHVRAITSYHLGVSLESTVGDTGIVNRVFEAGSSGVQLFFAISGFILALPFARHYLQQSPPLTLRSYFLRRLTRLEPPYILHLLFLFAISALVLRKLPSHPELYQNPHWPAPLLQHLGASLFYSNGFIFGTHPYPNVVLWSLEVEVQFYIIAPFIARVFKITSLRLRRSLLVAVILTLCLIKAAFPFSYRLDCSVLGNLHFFLIGFLLCDWYLTEWTTALRRYRYDLLFLVGFGGAILVHRTPMWNQVALPWFVLMSLVAAFRGVIVKQVLSYPLIATIGGMCYTIYMYHALMISLLVRFTARLQTHVFWLDMTIQLLVMTAVIVPICALLFFLFERPFMRRDWPARVGAVMSRRNPGRRSGPGGAPAEAMETNSAEKISER